jgi:hypothetical protein
MEVGLLTKEQKDLLVGQEFEVDCYFNPTQDAEDNWIISLEEIKYCNKEEFNWIKDLPLIPFKVKEIFD